MFTQFFNNTKINSLRLKSLSFALTITIFCSLYALSQPTHASESIIAENSGAADNLKSEEKAVRENMVVISRQLGVTCLTCHNTDNFKSDKKHEFQVAREHMKLTQMLIDNGMDGKKSYKADCYLCHRGVLKPVIQEPKPAK